MAINLPPETKEELIVWLEDVTTKWEEYWKLQPDSRYGKDFAAFVGERLLTDLYPFGQIIRIRVRR